MDTGKVEVVGRLPTPDQMNAGTHRTALILIVDSILQAAAVARPKGQPRKGDIKVMSSRQSWISVKAALRTNCIEANSDCKVHILCNRCCRCFSLETLLIHTLSSISIISNLLCDIVLICSFLWRLSPSPDRRW